VNNGQYKFQIIRIQHRFSAFARSDSDDSDTAGICMTLSGLAIRSDPTMDHEAARVKLNNLKKFGFKYPLASEERMLDTEESLGFSLPSSLCKLIMDLMCIWWEHHQNQHTVEPTDPRSYIVCAQVRSWYLVTCKNSYWPKKAKFFCYTHVLRYSRIYHLTFYFAL